MRLAALALLLLLVGCSSDSENPDSDIPDDVAAACGSLCAAQDPCDTIGWTHEECVSACAADVGTPSPECTSAIEAWAECTESDCTETACGEQHGARDAACGGTA